MLVVYFVNWSIAKGQNIEWINQTGWRYMFLSEAIPAAIFGVLLFFVPETPRYLAMQGHNEKALTILERINGAEVTNKILSDIKQTLVSKASSKIFAYGKKVIIIGILLSNIPAICWHQRCALLCAPYFRKYGCRQRCFDAADHCYGFD